MAVVSRIPRQRTVHGRLAVEVGLSLAGGLCVSALAGLACAFLPIEMSRVHLVLSLLAAAVGAAAVGLGHTASRIAGNRRVGWLLPALALYTVEVVANTALLPGEQDHAGQPGLGLLVDFLLIAALVVAAIRPPSSFGPGSAYVVVGLDLLLEPWDHAPIPWAGWFAGSGLLGPAALNVGILSGWIAASVALVAAGFRAASPPQWRLGIGLGLIGAAHLYRQLRPWPTAEPSIVFAALRLLGVLIVLLGMTQLLRRALTRVLEERFHHEEELRIATQRGESAAVAAAELRHEIGNGLVGLSGITRMLDDSAPPDARRAGSAAAAELARMSAMVRGVPPSPADGLYAAGEVVEELCALWRLGGMDVRAAVDGELLAVGRRGVLAQVLTNLLTNCARYAPGAPVRVAARRYGNDVVVEVHNGAATAADPAPPGSGIGLDLCHRLLLNEGGYLTVTPGGIRRPGFTVTVTLVAAGESGAAALGRVLAGGAR